MGHPDGFVSVIYRFESNSFTVVGKEGYDWRSPAILPRDRVIETELAPVVFRALDEIWTHDPELIRFIDSATSPPD